MSKWNGPPRAVDEAPPEMGSVIVEREVPHPPEKVWRALTLPHLVQEWLASADVKAEIGHRFQIQIEPQPHKRFQFDCEVTVAEPNKRLAYTWNAIGDGTSRPLKSTVTWSLTATPNGTLLRMEQMGFEQDQPNYYFGAKMGWPQMLSKLEEVLAGDSVG